MINDLDGANVGIHELEALADALCDPARTAHAEATLSKLVAAGGACSPLLDLLMDRLDGKGREYHIGTGARRAMARLLEEAARLRDEIKRLEAHELEAMGADLDGLPWEDAGGEGGDAILAAQRAARTKANMPKHRESSSGKDSRKRRTRRRP